MPELILKEEVFRVAGAAMEVYYTLGIGFLEPVYQESLAIEFNRRGIPFAREPTMRISYKEIELTKVYRPDFVCFGQIIAELKVQAGLTGIEEAQIINYLKITGMRVGLLINFGSRPTLEWRRFVV